MATKEVPAGKVPPQSLDAEKSLIGAVLIDDEVLADASEHVTAKDFYDKRHGLIYGAIMRLYEHHKPVDLLTLTEELKKKKEFDTVGGSSYLTELTNYVPTAAHAEAYAELVAQKAVRRRLIKASADISELGFDEDTTTQELLEKAEAELFSVSDQSLKQDLVSLESILTESFDRMEELHRNKGQLRGVTTGYRDLDNMTAGLQRSDLVVLAARPAMGKTTLVTNLAYNVATIAKQPVLFFSLEMSKEQLVDRMLADASGVDAWNIRTGNLSDEDFSKLSEAMGEMAEAPIYIDDTPGLSVLEMRTKARRAAHEQPLGLIIVDYLQLMQGSHARSDGNRVQEVSEISRGLKLIAREMNVPVVALSQLSRSVESRSPQIPQLADLRESGCLTGDTLIALADSGGRISIRELVGQSGFKVWAMNPQTFKLEPAIASNVFSTGRKKIYKLTTKLGRTIRATANHKFYRFGGWCRLDELEIGNKLALPRHIPTTEKNVSMKTAEAALLGHLIGDGCTIPRHAIQYTTREADLAETVVTLAKQAFGEKIRPRIVSERQWLQVYLSATEHLTHGHRNPIAAWLDSMGIFGLRSYEKRIPDIVFQQSAHIIGIFLRHLWSTDGCIKSPGTSRRHPTIYYASSSEELAHNVQSLLLRLGINAVLRSRSQHEKGRMQYHVLIMGKDDILRFAERIGAVGIYKTSALEKCVEYVSARPANTNRDIIPSDIWRTYVVPVARQNGVTSRGLQSALGNAYSGTGLYKQNLSRQRMMRLARSVGSDVPDNYLQYLAISDIYWDDITSIEPDGFEEVFDITVPGPNNFVAGDIIVHNSIEQDADIVMFIYREGYYNPETDRENITDLIISKHRNGPVGKVELYFHPERLRFMSLDKRHE